MANRLLKNMQTLETGIVVLFGRVVTSTSGTISTTDCPGMTITKTGSETGRYTITLADLYQKLRGVSVAIKGAADAAYTSAKGLTSIIRADAVATTGIIYVQFNDPDGSAADAELEDSAEFMVTLFLKNSSCSV